MRWFDPAGWVDLAQQHRAQRSTLVPSMIQMLLAQPLEEADLSALVAVSSGASPLADEVRQEFEARVPERDGLRGLRVHRVGVDHLGQPAGRPPGRQRGPARPRLRGDHPGRRGPRAARRPGRRDSASGRRACCPVTGTRRTRPRRRCRTAGCITGDIGHLDADGYLYVVDRKKDLIIRGGFNVYPRDVEDVLLAHPAVAQAGVVGRADPRLGEEVVAFAALRPGASASIGRAHRARQGAPGSDQVPARDQDRARPAAHQRRQARPQALREWLRDDA